MICIEVPEKIWDLANMPLVHSWDPKKMETFAMWSLGAVAGAAGAIPARPAAVGGGSGCRVARGSPRLG
jgi:hypothetical protein